jgi:hypothetical protein
VIGAQAQLARHARSPIAHPLAGICARDRSRKVLLSVLELGTLTARLGDAFHNVVTPRRGP